MTDSKAAAVQRCTLRQGRGEWQVLRGGPAAAQAPAAALAAAAPAADAPAKQAPAGAPFDAPGSGAPSPTVPCRICLMWAAISQ